MRASGREIVSVDFNAIQGFLLELKMAAIAEFDHRECLEFLGVYPGHARLEQLEAISDRLTPQAREYWQGEVRVIQRGVIYAGVWERYMQQVKFLLPKRRLLRR